MKFELPEPVVIADGAINIKAIILEDDYSKISAEYIIMDKGLSENEASNIVRAYLDMFLTKMLEVLEEQETSSSSN